MPASLSTTKVQFNFLEKGITLARRNSLKSFIVMLFKKERKSLEELNYVFCSDDYLLKINRQYLKHDYYTDIVSFGLSSPKEAIKGEIYISIDRVKENAQVFKSSIKKELHRVIFHGALHLCGYKDKKKAEVKLMRQMEDKYLDLYFSISK